MGGELSLGHGKKPSPFELNTLNIGCSGRGRPKYSKYDDNVLKCCILLIYKFHFKPIAFSDTSHNFSATALSFACDSNLHSPTGPVQ